MSNSQCDISEHSAFLGSPTTKVFSNSDSEHHGNMYAQYRYSCARDSDKP